MNKKLLYLLLALPMAACTPDNEETAVVQEPLTLSVDNEIIESDGKQTATFRIVDAKGLVLTDDADMMSKIYFKNENTGRRLARRTKEFRSVVDGEYTFTATYSGKPCSNSVKVSSVNRRSYEIFKKNVCLYRFTATWCQNCPSMTEGLNNVDDWTEDRIVELGLHGAGSTFALSDGSNYVADYLLTVFKAPGFPSCVYDLALMSDERSDTKIEDIIFNRIADAPATCGIKASSSYASGVFSLEAAVKTSTGGKYDIGYALLKDDCDGGAGAYEEEYDNVVMALSGNYLRMSSDAAQIGKDEEKQLINISKHINIPATDELGDYSVVVFALKQVGDKVNIDNVVEISLGASVDYEYNPSNE